MLDLSTVKTTLRCFATSTTAHGISRLVDESTSRLKRIVWLAVCSVAFVLLVTQLALITQEYKESPKITNTELVNEPIPFPSVSVCGLRAVDLFKLQDGFRILLNGYLTDPEVASNVFKAWNAKNQSNIKIPKSSIYGIIMKYVAIENMILSHMNSLEPRMNRSTGWPIISGMLSPSNFLGHSSRDIIMPLSIMKKKLIATCEFQYKECTYINFKRFFSPQYYNCYTFNASRLSSKTMLTGPYGGLSVVLFTPSIQMFKNNGLKNILQYKSIYDPILSGDGIRVTVHSPDEEPDVINKGVNIPNGFSSSVSLRVSKFNRYNTKASPCLTTGHVTGNRSNKYSQSTCFKECVQKQIIKQCGCVASTLPIEDHIDYPLCGSIGHLPDNCYTASGHSVLDDTCKEIAVKFLKRHKCERDTLSSIDQNPETPICDCPPPCLEYVYDTQYGLSRWPTLLDNKEFIMGLSSARFTERFDDVEKETCFSRLLNRTAEDRAEFLSEGHFIRLNVYLSGNTVLNVHEVPRYKFMQAVSDVGGQMGLWMGVSLITLAECFSLLISLGKMFVSHIFVRNNSVHSEEKGNSTETRQSVLKQGNI